MHFQFSLPQKDDWKENDDKFWLQRKHRIVQNNVWGTNLHPLGFTTDIVNNHNTVQGSNVLFICLV